MPDTGAHTSSRRRADTTRNFQACSARSSHSLTTRTIALRVKALQSSASRLHTQPTTSRCLTTDVSLENTLTKKPAHQPLGTGALRSSITYSIPRDDTKAANLYFPLADSNTPLKPTLCSCSIQRSPIEYFTYGSQFPHLTYQEELIPDPYCPIHTTAGGPTTDGFPVMAKPEDDADEALLDAMRKAFLEQIMSTPLTPRVPVMCPGELTPAEPSTNPSKPPLVGEVSPKDAGKPPSRW